MRYARIDSQSAHGFSYSPSTAKQRDMGRELAQEMERIGVSNVWFDEEHCVVYGTVPSTLPDGGGMSVGFVSHLDTTPDVTGTNVKPWLLENYQGGDVVLNKEQGIVLHAEEFPRMSLYLGDDLIFSDGTTLLGADDKAGVAEIMYAAEYLVTHPDFKHGEVCIGFTPDEEIGRGADYFEVEKFGAKYAYTMDGGEIGELEFENFNAAAATVHIQGRNVHPGYAKGKMKNAIRILEEFDALLPASEKPENTEGYEGFFHIVSFEGSVEEARAQYIIRDHSLEKFEQKKALIVSCAESINARYGDGTARVELRHQYYNMRSEVEPHYFIIEKAIRAMEMEGITPKIQPIRGGTDGARLSFMGLPCPNLFAGGHNFHGRMEFVPLESMQKAAQVLLNLVRLFAE